MSPRSDEHSDADPSRPLDRGKLGSFTPAQSDRLGRAPIADVSRGRPDFRPPTPENAYGDPFFGVRRLSSRVAHSIASAGLS